MSEFDDAMTGEASPPTEGGDSRSTDSYKAYNVGVGRITRDPGPVQAEWLDKAKAGDKAAYAHLWAQAARIVLHVFNQLQRAGKLPSVAYDDMDAIQEANIAVGKAILRWEPARGSLATWLIPHIRGAIMDYAATHNTGGIGSKHNALNRASMDSLVETVEIPSSQDTPGVEQTEGIELQDSLVYEAPVFEDGETLITRLQLEDSITSIRDTEVKEIAWNVYVLGRTGLELADFMGVSYETIRRKLKLANELITKYFTSSSA